MAGPCAAESARDGAGRNQIVVRRPVAPQRTDSSSAAVAAAVSDNDGKTEAQNGVADTDNAKAATTVVAAPDNSNVAIPQTTNSNAADISASTPAQAVAVAAQSETTPVVTAPAPPAPSAAAVVSTTTTTITSSSATLTPNTIKTEQGSSQIKSEQTTNVAPVNANLNTMESKIATPCSSNNKNNNTPVVAVATTQAPVPPLAPRQQPTVNAQTGSVANPSTIASSTPASASAAPTNSNNVINNNSNVTTPGAANVVVNKGVKRPLPQVKTEYSTAPSSVPNSAQTMKPATGPIMQPTSSFAGASVVPLKSQSTIRYRCCLCLGPDLPPPASAVTGIPATTATTTTTPAVSTTTSSSGSAQVAQQQQPNSAQNLNSVSSANGALPSPRVSGAPSATAPSSSANIATPAKPAAQQQQVTAPTAAQAPSTTSSTPAPLASAPVKTSANVPVPQASATSTSAAAVPPANAAPALATTVSASKTESTNPAARTAVNVAPGATPANTATPSTTTASSAATTQQQPQRPPAAAATAAAAIPASTPAAQQQTTSTPNNNNNRPGQAPTSSALPQAANAGRPNVPTQQSYHPQQGRPMNMGPSHVNGPNNMHNNHNRGMVMSHNGRPVHSTAAMARAPGYRARPGHPHGYGQPPHKMARTGPVMAGVNAPAVKALPKIDFPKVNSTSFVRVLGCTMHEECMALAKRHNLLSKIDRQKVNMEEYDSLDSEKFGANVLAKNITIVEGLVEATGLRNELFSFSHLGKVSGPTKPLRRTGKKKPSKASESAAANGSNNASTSNSANTDNNNPDVPKASVPVAVFKHAAVYGPCKIREERLGSLPLSSAVQKMATKQAEQEAQEKAKQSRALDAKRSSTRRVSTRASAAAAAKEHGVPANLTDKDDNNSDDSSASAVAKRKLPLEGSDAPLSPTSEKPISTPTTSVAATTSAPQQAQPQPQQTPAQQQPDMNTVRCARQSLGQENDNWKAQREELKKMPECIRYTSPLNVLHIYQPPTLKSGPQLSIKESGVCSPLREGTNRYRTFSLNHGPGQEEWGAVAASHAEAARQLYGADFGKIFPNVGYLIRNGIPVMYGLLQSKELVGISPGTVFWTMARGDMVSSSWNFLERAVSSFRLASEVRPMLNLALDLAITELEAAKQKSATLSNPLLGLLTSQLEHALDREEAIRRQALEHQFRPAPEPVGSNASHCENCHRELFHHYFYCSTCDCLGPEKSMDLNATGTTATLNHAALAIMAANKKPVPGAPASANAGSGAAGVPGTGSGLVNSNSQQAKPTMFAARRPAPGGMTRPVPSAHQHAMANGGMNKAIPGSVNAGAPNASMARPTQMQLDAQRRSAFSNPRGGMPIKTERPAPRDLETRSEPGEPVARTCSSSSIKTELKSEAAKTGSVPPAATTNNAHQARPMVNSATGVHRSGISTSTGSAFRPGMSSNGTNIASHRPGMTSSGLPNGMSNKPHLGKLNTTMGGPEKKTTSRRKPRSPVPTWLRVDSRVIVNDSGQIGTVTKSGHGFYTVQLDGTTKTVLKRRNGLSSPAAVRSNVVFSCTEQEAEMLGTSPDSIATWRELVGGSMPGGKILPPCPPLGMHAAAYGKAVGKDDQMSRSASSACAIANAMTNQCRMSGVLGSHAPGVRTGPMSSLNMHTQARAQQGQPPRGQWNSTAASCQGRHPQAHGAVNAYNGANRVPSGYHGAPACANGQPMNGAVSRPGASAASSAGAAGSTTLQQQQQQQQHVAQATDKKPLASGAAGSAPNGCKPSATVGTNGIPVKTPGVDPNRCKIVPNPMCKVLRSRPAVFCSECWQQHRSQHNGHLTLCLERWYFEDLRMRVQEVAQLLRTRTASIEHLVVKPPTTIEEMLKNVHLARARNVPVALPSLMRTDLAPRKVAPNQIPHPITSVMKPIVAGVVDRDLCIRVWYTEQQRIKKMASSAATSSASNNATTSNSATSGNTNTHANTAGLAGNSSTNNASNGKTTSNDSKAAPGSLARASSTGTQGTTSSANGKDNAPTSGRETASSKKKKASLGSQAVSATTTKRRKKSSVSVSGASASATSTVAPSAHSTSTLAPSTMATHKTSTTTTTTATLPMTGKTNVSAAAKAAGMVASATSAKPAAAKASTIAPIPSVAVQQPQPQQQQPPMQSQQQQLPPPPLQPTSVIITSSSASKGSSTPVNAPIPIVVSPLALTPQKPSKKAKATRGPALGKSNNAMLLPPMLPLDPFDASPMKQVFPGMSSSSIVSDLDQCSIPDSPGWRSFLLADDTERELFDLNDDNKSVSSLTSAAASNEEVHQLLYMKREMSDASSVSFMDDPVTDATAAVAAVGADAQSVGPVADVDTASIFDENDFGMAHMSVVDPLMDVNVTTDDHVPSSNDSTVSIGPVTASLVNSEFSEWLTEIC